MRGFYGNVGHANHHDQHGRRQPGRHARRHHAGIDGFFVAPPIARMLDRANSRFAVLVISSLSAIVLIARSVG
jgi:hypothetical protein